MRLFFNTSKGKDKCRILAEMMREGLPVSRTYPVDFSIGLC